MRQGDLREFLLKSRATKSNPIPNLYLVDLVEICKQVASAVAYLASIRFVHRDIAARNCLVGEKKVIKLADFGMARDVHKREYYKKKDGPMPFRWMAPEAIVDGR